ncbi:MAG: Fic family protein [Acutalibacteraceae bacterium]|nr:Fic family protein [Acutalibacteraceae bacterium]
MKYQPKDPYLYDDVSVLKNLLNIKDEKALETAESNITFIKLLDVDKLAENCVFNADHLKKIHKYIFGDIYEWAGEYRVIPMVKSEIVLGGDTVRYRYPDNIEKDLNKAIDNLLSVNWSILSIEETADKFARIIASIWQVHPFREGNTRSVITFATQFAQAYGFNMDKQLLKDFSGYVRNSLVKASDGPYSEYNYLSKIFKDAILNG